MGNIILFSRLCGTLDCTFYKDKLLHPASIIRAIIAQMMKAVSTSEMAVSFYQTPREKS
jgi:hypothetical protein